MEGLLQVRSANDIFYCKATVRKSSSKNVKRRAFAGQRTNKYTRIRDTKDSVLLVHQ